MAAKKQGQEKHVSSVWKPIALLILICALFTSAVACRGTPSEEPPDPPITVDTVELFLSMDDPDEEEKWKTTLTVAGMDGLKDTTFANINSNLTQGVGDKSDRINKTYFAFSFYLINGSTCSVSYEMKVNVARSTGTILDAVRVLLVEGDKPITQGDIYAKAESTQEGRDALAEHTDYQTKTFESDSVVCTRRVDGFAQNAKVKHTLVVWLEGWDVDCTDAILSHSFAMDIGISAIQN